RFAEMIHRERQRLALPPDYAARIEKLGAESHWQMTQESQQDDAEFRRTPNAIKGRRSLQLRGAATLVDEADDNRSVRISEDGEFGCLIEANGNQRPFVGDFTLSMFVQPTRLHSGTILVGRRWSGPDEGLSLVASLYTPPGRLARHGGSFPRPGMITRVSDPPRWQHGREDMIEHVMMPLRWSHLTLRRQHDRLSLWINGRSIHERTVAQATPDFKTLVFGSNNANVNTSDWVQRVWVGYIDEIVLFDRALDDNELVLLLGVPNLEGSSTKSL
ncbi:MAG: LamG-like jellyroll fold domain-containing protein, partial [Planctomycetota bacterium]